MISCPRCSYLRAFRRPTASYPILTLFPRLQGSATSQSTWIHHSARQQPSLPAYNRENNRILRTGRRREHSLAASFPSSQESVTAQDHEPFTPETRSSGPILYKDTLPTCCPGCGAYAQTIDSNEPGYYSKTRKKTRKLFKKIQGTLSNEQNTGEEGNAEVDTESGEDNIVALTQNPPRPAGDVLLDDPEHAAQSNPVTLPSQVCDRCHNLLYHNRGESAPSPTIDSVRAFLEESPYKMNRVYHIIDAADFPMSLIPNIYEALDLQEQRSRNRRSKTERYKRGKKMTTISFIITRSDLLAATKEQVDSLMQRMRHQLLDVLKLRKDDVRLGNVHLMSAHRGWWTKAVKVEISKHGGGIWVVGKANVGKSSFIATCFPKDAKPSKDVERLLSRRLEEEKARRPADSMEDPDFLDSNDLLPPAPREVPYPTLPIVSSLPGTTVSPIRILFGRGHGEMIDLPGLDRSTLQDYVKDEHKSDLIMTKRVAPERLTIKSGQSLLLGGGLIRITPVAEEQEDMIVLASCFVPIETHITRTDKAIEIQSQLRQYSQGGGGKGKIIVQDGVFSGDIISSAGIFELDTDVTKNHLPTTVKKRLDDQGIKPKSLPYKVLSRDILIEGCGWVELTTEIRARWSNNLGEDDSSTPTLPRVEVFSPYGQHIGSRPPMETWNFIRDKKAADKRKKVMTGGSYRPQRQNISHKKRTVHGAKV